MNGTEKQIEWTTESGHEVVVSIALRTSKQVSLDGDICEVDDCTIRTAVTINGREEDGWLRDYNEMGCVARYGRLAIDQTNYDRIQAAMDEIKQAPEWIANEKLIAKNQAECADYDKAQAYMDRIESGSY